MTDDGVGSIIARMLSRMNLPANIRILEEGTEGIRLLDKILEFDKVIIIDAIKTGRTPGEVMILNGKQLISKAKKEQYRSVHDINLISTLKLGYELFPEAMPREIILVGIEAERIEPGLGLSKKVKNFLPKVLEVILDLVKS